MRRTRHWNWQALVLVAALVTASVGAADIQAALGQVRVSGLVERPFVLDTQWLAGDHGIAPVTVSRQLDREPEPSRVETFKGYRLRDLLMHAKVVRGAPHGWKQMVIVASAADGYQVVFSYSEITNTPVGEQVLVYFERDGQRVDLARTGFGLISAADTRTGARHVKQLTGLELKLVQ
jgi:hypothetical protein